MNDLSYKSYEELFILLLKNSKEIELTQQITSELQSRIDYLWGNRNQAISKTFSIRVNKKESDDKSTEKISQLIEKIKTYKS